MSQIENLKIRPYARLLSMLGDQLIKNEIVALTELIKNAYDADADCCRIAFCNVNDDYTLRKESSIVISDDGYGMSKAVLTTHFLNPATPVKSKDIELKKSTKNRTKQGEKGVGRFSMLKLGRTIKVYSKEEESPEIHRIIFDFTSFDDEMISDSKNGEPVFLDELRIQYELVNEDELPTSSLIREKHKGTDIVVSELKGNWNDALVNKLKQEVIQFCPLEIEDDHILENRDFAIVICKNGVEDPYYLRDMMDLARIIDNKALYKISGKYLEKAKELQFSISEAGKAKQKHILSLLPATNLNELENKLIHLSDYSNNVKKFYEGGKTTECGPFSFEFYVFDFAANSAEDYGLSRVEKEQVKKQGIYLYRDGIRVQPYGTPGDDWLQIDRKRANARASQSFSNAQLIGQIRITRNDNHKLKDKTSREGIIEDGSAFLQLTTIVRLFLSLIKTGYYQNYRSAIEKRKEIQEEKTWKGLNESFQKLEETIQDNETAQRHLNNISRLFTIQKEAYTKRVELVESLAGVGLSVDASSHDIMLSIGQLKEILNDIHYELKKKEETFDISTLKTKIARAEDLLGMIDLKMRDQQTLFVSSKQRAKKTKIEPLVKKIQEIYSKSYSRNNITIEIRHVGKSPVEAKLIDAVIYQVFINLFDNALYWLKMYTNQKKVVITFDGDRQEVIFSDTGMGVAKDDAPFIFDAFFSGKGEEGRGLGLYIAKRLLNRYYYDIELIENQDEKIEKGANLRISFISNEEMAK